MTIPEFIAMRSDRLQREDFLHRLQIECLPLIGTITRRILGNLATQEIIRGESLQAFLLKANAAIDTARTIDNGGGKNNPVAWCKWKGAHGVRDYLRIEYSRHSKWTYHQKKFESSVFYLEEIKSIAERKDNYQGTFGGAGWSSELEDRENYEEKILSHMNVEEVIATLQPLDQQIINLVVYGRDGDRTLIHAGTYGARTHYLAAHLSRTTGYSESVIYRRMRHLRRILKLN